MMIARRRVEYGDGEPVGVGEWWLVVNGQRARGALNLGVALAEL